MRNIIPKSKRFLLNPNYFSTEQLKENLRNILTSVENYRKARDRAILEFLRIENPKPEVEDFRQKYLQEQELRKKYMITDLSVFKDKLGAIDNDLPLKNRLIEIIKLLSKLDNIEDLLNENDSQLRQEMVRDIMSKLPDLQQNTFYTLKDKANTGVGGSSMGGLYAFYLGAKYKDYVDFSLCFSPAFLLYKEDFFKKEVEEKITSNKEYGKFFLFCGGVELESIIEPLTSYMYKHLTSVGFDSNQVRYIYDSSAVHNEGVWTFYFDVAIKHWGILEKK
jgi:hypothetical protein